MFAGTWKIIGAVQTVEDSLIAIGENKNSPTPYGTWSGTINSDTYDFVNGHYFKTKQEAWNDLIERAGVFYEEINT